MQNGFIAIVFVIALATATHLPDCTNFTRFPPGGCVSAVQSLLDARQYEGLGPSGKYWLLALWTKECNTHVDKETCVACNTMNVEIAWANTNATTTCDQLAQSAANIVGAPSCPPGSCV